MQYGSLNPTGSEAQGFSTTSLYDANTNRLIVFGGELSTSSPRLNSTAIFSNANGLGGTLAAWTTLSPTGPLPPGRAQHSAVYVCKQPDGILAA